jgi:hypothetical protein
MGIPLMGGQFAVRSHPCEVGRNAKAILETHTVATLRPCLALIGSEFEIPHGFRYVFWDTHSPLKANPV